MARQSFRQGYYKPKNVKKYKGDPTKIRYLSSWELHFDQFLDNNPNILEWGAETVKIPYLKPTDGKVHTYYVDYYIKYKDKDGKILQELVEIKPDKQTRPPRKSRNPKTALYEQLTYAVNVAKWEAAALFCKQRGIKFRIVTERQLFK